MGNKKGQQEQGCIDKVNEFCFPEDFDCDEIDYAKAMFRSEALTYGFQYNAGQKLESEDEYFDFRPIAKLLTSAINTDFENAKIGQNKTEFPDFKCKNGLIEHFNISGTKERKNGGSQIKEDRAKCDKDVEDAVRSGENHICKSFSVHQSYDDFIASFKRNWKKHISKLRNYQGNKDNVCFMIESDGFGLKMERKPDIDPILGITTGKISRHWNDFSRSEKFNSPLLGRCKELLEYIYQYKDEVQYVIFVSSNGVEIIKTDMAEYIANLLGDYRVYSTITVECHAADVQKVIPKNQALF